MPKDTKSKSDAAAATRGMTRTVKIADQIHHKIRMLSVKHRMPMQYFIERLLLHGLRSKAWESFNAEDEKIAA